jgi:hypothetical protein
VIAAIVLYETVMKPQINSQAKDAALKAAKSANSSLASQASSAQSAASVASSQAQAAQSAASKANDNASKANVNASVASSIAGGGGGGASGSDGQNINGGTAVAFSVQANTAQAPKNDPTKVSTFPGLGFSNKKLLVVTYMIMQNPNGDTGTMSILQGNTNVLLTEGLANFRDLDHPFQVEPLIFNTAQPLKVRVNCVKAATADHICHPSVLFTGRLVNNKKAAA